jgi:transposase-like protein
MKSKRYPKEFKREAVKQVTERGYSVSEVAQWLDYMPGSRSLESRNLNHQKILIWSLRTHD